MFCYIGNILDPSIVTLALCFKQEKDNLSWYKCWPHTKWEIGRLINSFSFLPYSHRLSETQFLWKLPTRPSADEELYLQQPILGRHHHGNVSPNNVSQPLLPHFHFSLSLTALDYTFQVKHQNVRQKYKWINEWWREKHNMDKSHRHVTWKKLDIKKHTLFDSIYINFENKQN